MTETEVEAIACHAVGTTEKALRLLIQENRELRARIAELEAQVKRVLDRVDLAEGQNAKLQVEPEGTACSNCREPLRQPKPQEPTCDRGYCGPCCSKICSFD